MTLYLVYNNRVCGRPFVYSLFVCLFVIVLFVYYSLPNVILDVVTLDWLASSYRGLQAA